MAKRPFVEFLLQLINFIFSLCGLGVLFYGLFCLIKWKQQVSVQSDPHNADEAEYVAPNRRLLDINPSEVLSDRLPTAWFIYLLITIGAILFIISCFGYVGTASRSPCCLISYSVFLVALVLAELAVAAFMIVDHSWNKVVPADRSGNFYSVYYFLNKNWTIIRWIALVLLILQVIALLLALYLRYVFSRAKYVSSDDESVDYPRKLQAFVARKSK